MTKIMSLGNFSRKRTVLKGFNRRYLSQTFDKMIRKRTNTITQANNYLCLASFLLLYSYVYRRPWYAYALT